MQTTQSSSHVQDLFLTSDEEGDATFLGFEEEELGELHHCTLTGSPDWKKWHVMKLRAKLNHLQINDRGNRTELVERLEQYYKTLPNRINMSCNPWIREDDELSEILYDVPPENTKQSQLLINIVDILEVLSSDYLANKRQHQQHLYHQQHHQRQQQYQMP